MLTKYLLKKLMVVFAFNGLILGAVQRKDSNGLQWKKTDFSLLLKSLEMITDYASNHRNTLEINLMFGVFLTKVNLNAISTEQTESMPLKEMKILKKTLDQCKTLLEFYSNIIHQNKSSENQRAIFLTSTWNDSTWTSALPMFTFDLQVHTSKNLFQRALEVDLMQWEYYVHLIMDYERLVPNPALSEQCLVELALNPASDLDLPRQCQLTEDCYNAVKKGTGFGYAVTHRLIMLLYAHWGRVCYVDTPVADLVKMKQFCSAAFSEAGYISSHQFQLRDLFMEQVTLCLLLGHLEFLQRPWIYQIIFWQEPSGCFQEHFTEDQKFMMQKSVEYGRKVPTAHMVGDYVRNKSLMIEEGRCDGHVTGVAAAALASAVRFIANKYYLY